MGRRGKICVRRYGVGPAPKINPRLPRGVSIRGPQCEEESSFGIEGWMAQVHLWPATMALEGPWA
jgi:hypothetical protein